MRIDINVAPSTNFKDNSSLFEVYTLSYEDNYHKVDGEPSSELERAVRNIRARYKNLNKYHEARLLYRDWMDYLAAKHGGKEILKKKIKAGLVDDFIPRKPRLKNSPSLKYMYEHNIVVSELHDNSIDMDAVDALVELWNSEDKNTVTDITVTTVNDKEAEKIANDITSTGKRIVSHAFDRESDFVESYFASRRTKSKKKGKKGNKKKNKDLKKDRFLLIDLINGLYDYSDNVEDSENSNIMYYNGLILNSGTTEEMETYRRLNELGWNSYKMMKKANYGKRLSGQFKPQKKAKKKKKNKGFDAIGSYEGLLIEIAQDAGYNDFEEFNADMLDMTAESVFGKAGLEVRDQFKH